uniref:Uncharacterized protein n=1 Tax=Nothoprocta perdicaria TaxID=30464 RepID=A0A8C7EF30_NOTPE
MAENPGQRHAGGSCVADNSFLWVSVSNSEYQYLLAWIFFLADGNSYFKSATSANSPALWEILEQFLTWGKGENTAWGVWQNLHLGLIYFCPRQQSYQQRKHG